MSIYADTVKQARKQISDTAEAMLSGKSPYIDGARRICRLLEQAGLDGFEEPFVAFVGIASETDEVPTGYVRDHWHPDAKIKLEPSWTQAEDSARVVGEAACRLTIALLTANPG